MQVITKRHATSHPGGSADLGARWRRRSTLDWRHERTGKRHRAHSGREGRVVPRTARGPGATAAAEPVGRGLRETPRLAGLRRAGHDEWRLRGHAGAARRVGGPGWGGP